MYVSTLSRVIPFILSGFVISLFFLASPNQAAASCGNFIISGFGQTFSNPILDCDDPFGISHFDTSTSTLHIDGQEINNSDTVELVFSGFNGYEVTSDENTLLQLYGREDDDYIVDPDNSLVISGPGDYTVVMTTLTGPPPVVVFNSPILQKAIDFILPTAYAFTTTARVVNFTVVEASAEEPPEPLSERLLQYEPILYFHEDEDYFPMNLDAFVERSGLWNGSIGVITRGDNNGLDLDTLALLDDTDEMTVNFSSDEAGTFDLAEAKNRYDALVTAGDAEATYYAYESEDSYTDDFGTEHEFIVLQYWYFYAMNNWGEQGGYNNHEGDWESIFVFLDKDTEDPEYVAFSAHHNDGDPSFDIKQYDSVRKEWDEVTTDEDQAFSYVALGSHANYSKNGDQEVLTLKGNKYDKLSNNSLRYDSNVWVQRIQLEPTSDGWLKNYKGLYGADGTYIEGSAGVQSPYYSDVSGAVRFHNPIEWAGIDQTAKTTLSTPQQVFNLSKQKVKLVFDETLEAGTELSSQWYQEIIDFGSNYGELTLLPHFWDFGTSLDNDTFSVDVSLGYSEAELAELGITENNLGVYYFNEATGLWEYVSSLVDMGDNEVTFTTTHFSRYTIGVAPTTAPAEPEPNIEEPEVTESSNGSRTSTRTSRSSQPTAQVAGISTTSWQEILLETYTELLQIKISMSKGEVTESEANTQLTAIVERLRNFIENF